MADDEEEIGEEENGNTLGVRDFLLFYFRMTFSLRLMKVIVMNKMNVMVLVKRNYRMEILMKDNINMDKDMVLEPIDFLMMLVI